MKRTYWLLIMLLIMGCVIGCYSRRVQEFVSSGGSQTFENWHVYAFLDGTPDNNSYRVTYHALTSNKNGGSFRQSAYNASLDSFKLEYYDVSNNVITVPLCRLEPSDLNDARHLVQMLSCENESILIPPEINELRATVAATFTDRQTSNTVSKVFLFKMKRRHREIVPVTI